MPSCIYAHIYPSNPPSINTSVLPSIYPSYHPSTLPSIHPTIHPTIHPIQPYIMQQSISPAYSFQLTIMPIQLAGHFLTSSRLRIMASLVHPYPTPEVPPGTTFPSFVQPSIHPSVNPLIHSLAYPTYSFKLLVHYLN
mmetsp:Transcript_12024/g.26214  ORF Transcript_12024/g.26214 Transcript_12024/m.26214 type:complete len:138 (-) Transcript_12024:853-1266(-)